MSVRIFSSVCPSSSRLIDRARPQTETENMGEHHGAETASEKQNEHTLFAPSNCAHSEETKSYSWNLLKR